MPPYVWWEGRWKLALAPISSGQRSSCLSCFLRIEFQFQFLSAFNSSVPLHVFHKGRDGSDWKDDKGCKRWLSRRCWWSLSGRLRTQRSREGAAYKWGSNTVKNTLKHNAMQYGIHYNTLQYNAIQLQSKAIHNTTMEMSLHRSLSSPLPSFDEAWLQLPFNFHTRSPPVKGGKEEKIGM